MTRKDRTKVAPKEGHLSLETKLVDVRRLVNDALVHYEAARRLEIIV